jgi:phosphoribosylamine---glycine ligase
MSKHNILILGSGGREHTLAWKMNLSEHCGNLYIAPGNGGTQDVGINVPLDPMDSKAVSTYCIEKDIDILVIGPEAPLVEGIVDHFRGNPALSNVLCVGPAAQGAMLEGSKAFAKKFMAKYDIPTAGYQEFTPETREAGKTYLRNHDLPIVLKADGLAAGKGVVICNSVDEAIAEFDQMLDGKFGAAGERVVVEEFLDGIEFSVFALTDGKDYQILPIAKDYKRIGEGDTGLNTGGMGSVSPVPFVDDALMRKVIERIVDPTIRGIAAEQMDYCGFVFIGLIMVGGDPFVIEYNCRMGDPETQVVMPRLTNDLLDLFLALKDGTIRDQKIALDPRTATAVVCVSGGYPGSYEKGMQITLPQVSDGSLIFHAGTRLTGGKLETSGGRVVAATTLSGDMQSALAGSNTLAHQIQYEGKYFRPDIGFDL